MRAFVFRAQAALDLRRTRDEAAQRDLAAANAAVQRAEQEWLAAVAAWKDANAQAVDEQRRGTGLATQMWYRNWIVRQQRVMASRRDTVAERRRDADGARERATKAHIDVRVLENLRERQWRAYTDEERRAEQKDMDWLAVLRSSQQAVNRKETG